MFLCAGLDLCDLNFLPVPRREKMGFLISLLRYGTDGERRLVGLESC